MISLLVFFRIWVCCWVFCLFLLVWCLCFLGCSISIVVWRRLSVLVVWMVFLV